MKTVQTKRKDGLLVNIAMFETLDECVASAGADEKIVKFLNMYAAQKDAFPEAYDDLIAAVEGEAGFARHSTKEQTTIGGKAVEVTKFIDPHRTEQDYIDDFRTQASTHGNHKLGLSTDPTGQTVKDWLQSVLDRKTYTLDLSKAGRERKTKLDVVFIQGATGIIKGTASKGVEHWQNVFDKLEVEYGDFTDTSIDEGVRIQTLAKALYDWTLKRQAQQFA